MVEIIIKSLIILFVLLFVNSFFNKWLWTVTIVLNSCLYMSCLPYLARFNKFFIGYQEIFEFKIRFLNFDYYLMFGFDGISIFFVILTIFIINLCLLLLGYKNFLIEEYIFILVIVEVLLILSFLSLDLFIFYVTFESVVLPVYFLILIWGPSVRRSLAAYYFFMFTFVSSMLMLVGLFLIIQECGTTNLLVLEQYNFDKELQEILWFLFFWGFAVKIPMFPFHIWLPEAHVEAPTEGSIILAALLLKLGGYGFIRVLLNLFPYANSIYGNYVIYLALVGVIHSSVVAISQTDLKKLIAYASIAHMNFVVLGIFSNTIYGILGSLVLMFAHGLVSAGLFGCVGMLYERYHTRISEFYSGLQIGMPLFSSFFFLLVLGNISFPGTFNFAGEFLIFISLFKINFVIPLLASSGMFLSAAYTLIMFNRLNNGNVSEEIDVMIDLNIIEFHFLFFLVSMVIFFGLFPNFIIKISYISVKILLLKNDLF